jgi:hypothetical protein
VRETSLFDLAGVRRQAVTAQSDATQGDGDNAGEHSAARWHGALRHRAVGRESSGTTAVVEDEQFTRMEKPDGHKSWLRATNSP